MLLACVPAAIWGYIFYKKDPVYKPRAALTFLMGMISVLPILLYKWSWQFFPDINVFTYTDQMTTDLLGFTALLALPLGTVMAFMFVGVIEEYMKHVVVEKTDKGFFRNIDDSIEFAIMAALGFAFIENILYFYYIWASQGAEVLFISFIFRSVFSTFVHILFSGIYGYFYGIAYFADPIWSEEQRKKRHKIIDWMHNILHLRKNRVFATEKVAEGLLIAVVLHALFNILLEMQLTFFMVPFLIFGYSYLAHLFQKKENLKGYGYIVGEDSPAHLHQVIWEKLPRPKLPRRKAGKKKV